MQLSVDPQASSSRSGGAIQVQFKALLDDLIRAMEDTIANGSDAAMHQHLRTLSQQASAMDNTGLVAQVMHAFDKFGRQRQEVEVVLDNYSRNRASIFAMAEEYVLLAGKPEGHVMILRACCAELAAHS